MKSLAEQMISEMELIESGKTRETRFVNRLCCFKYRQKARPGEAGSLLSDMCAVGIIAGYSHNRSANTLSVMVGGVSLIPLQITWHKDRSAWSLTDEMYAPESVECTLNVF